MKRFHVAPFFIMIIAAIIMSGCGGLWKPSKSTSVNAPTFPQQDVIAKVTAPPEPLELSKQLPPAPSENNAFVMVGGSPQYRIGIGDVLDLTVTRGSIKDSIQTAVRSDGKIFVLLAEISVDGLTAEQAAEAISKALSLFFRDPRTVVQVKEFNSKRVRVFGAVGTTTRASSATIPLTGRLTLMEAIGRAGGFHPMANMERVRVRRADGKIYVVNMFWFMQEGEVALEFVMDHGDAVFIPEQIKGQEQRVFLLGEVKAPGPVAYFPSLTMGQLIAQVGGWTDGALYEESAVIRAKPEVTEILTVNLRELLLEGNKRIDQYLQPNDIVFVPRTKIANWNAFVNQLMPTFTLINAPISTALNIKALQDIAK